MTQKLLPYDRGIVKQETGYWCGPASAQVVLNSKGINVAESTLAREIGTTQNGTDYIGLIERVLDARAPSAKYTSVYMPNDPATSSQKDRLWRDIVRSVNAGWGVIVNIVAPSSNYPRGVNGSTSPAYGGGTVFHYMSVMGYDDAIRAVWIADSGFTPYGYWMSFDQLATLVPPKGYAFADVDSAPVPTPTPEEGDMDFATFKAYMDAVASDTKDVREQMCGENQRDAGEFKGWPQLGNRTVVDALAIIGEHLGIVGFSAKGGK